MFSIEDAVLLLVFDLQEISTKKKQTKMER